MNESYKVTRLPDMKAIEAQAAEWLVRLDDEEATAQDYAAFFKWRNQSEQRREAFERIKTAWGAFDRLEHLNEFATAPDCDVVTGQGKQRPLGFRFFSMAASIALVAGLGILYTVLSLNFGTQIYQTPVGARKSVELRDGTNMELNTDSLIEVSYSKSLREVRLVKGEAYFEVAHDSSRPFSVFAGRGIVTAVGTAFTVRKRADKVDVVVSEGRVALSVLDEVSKTEITPLAELEAGQDALFQDKLERLEELDLEELNRKLSWRNGILSFEGEPLSDVVSDMSRYTGINIEIDDNQLKQMPVDGSFRIGEMESMLEALEVMAGLQVEFVNDNHIRLSRK